MNKIKQKCQHCKKPFAHRHLIKFKGLILCQACCLVVGERMPTKPIKLEKDDSEGSQGSQLLSKKGDEV